jgi:predicted signal transduction protein with EAL and GGDEF domain
MRLVLNAYRRAGIRFAIDDLGEGFATTELLDTAEPEFVKLARSLTMNAARRSTRVAIKTALGFARAHKSIVIAEGVENELVSDQIRSLAIPLGQGFGLGRPTAAADLLDSAAAWRTRDTLRPLRPRNVQARAHSGTSVQEREGSTRRDGIALPVNPSRRSLDVRQRRTVKGSGDAPPGRAS